MDKSIIHTKNFKIMLLFVINFFLAFLLFIQAEKADAAPNVFDISSADTTALQLFGTDGGMGGFRGTYLSNYSFGAFYNINGVSFDSTSSFDTNLTDALSPLEGGDGQGIGNTATPASSAGFGYPKHFSPGNSMTNGILDGIGSTNSPFPSPFVNFQFYQDKIYYGGHYYCTYYYNAGQFYLFRYPKNTACPDTTGTTYGYHSVVFYLDGTPLSGYYPPPIPPSPPPDIPGVSCEPLNVPDISTVQWWDFFDLPFSATSTGSFTGSNGAVTSRYAQAQAVSADFLDNDIFTVNGVNAFSFINTGSLDYPGTGTSSLSPGAGSVNGLFTLSFESSRNGGKRNWNLLQFFGVASFPFTDTWGYFYNFDDDAGATRMNYDGSGTVTLSSTTPVSNFGITAQSGFNGMRVGTSTGYITYYQCSGSNGNDCELDMTSSGVVCKGAVAGYTQYGNCAFSAPTVCSPVTSSGVVVAPNPLPGQQYVVDGSGAVVQTPYNVPPVSINSKGLFDCYYVEWTDILGCAKEIGNNIASALTNGSASLTTGSKTTINGTLQEIGNSTGSLNMEAVTADDAQTNVADYMIRRTWNQAVAGDNVYSEWNNYILYGALILAVVGVMGVIVMSNHSSKK